MTALRKNWIWIALVIAVLASWWVAGLDEETSAKSEGRTNSASTSGAAGKSAPTKKSVPQYNPAQALALVAKGFTPREGMSKLRRDPFSVVSFAPPPPAAPPPPKPTAPPLKFKYLGVLREDNARAIFLDSGGQLLIARKGDTLAGDYLVLDINDTQMHLEYTPLAERQTLNFGR